MEELEIVNLIKKFYTNSHVVENISNAQFVNNKLYVTAYEKTNIYFISSNHLIILDDHGNESRFRIDESKGVNNMYNLLLEIYSIERNRMIDLILL